MNNFIRKWGKRAASLKISALGLILLFILTVLGTLYQVDHGLYEAQIRFFHSWYLFFFDFIPFPGGQLVMWVLALNLLASIHFRLRWKVKKIGLILSHGGLILLLAGSFVTFRFSTESFLSLNEGESSSVSTDYNDWELAVWKNSRDKQIQVFAFDLENINKGEVLKFEKLGVAFRVEKVHENCDAYGDNPGQESSALNASGIRRLAEKKKSKTPDRNLPGLLLREQNAQKALILFGGENNNLAYPTSKGNILLKLRKKQYALPISIHLKDFVKKDYPGTRMAKSYESTVGLHSVDEKDASEREVRIYMNHPLRYRNFTFFQSSYRIDDKTGKETSILAVVENKGKYLPYISSSIIFLGLAIHLLGMLWSRTTGGKK